MDRAKGDLDEARFSLRKSEDSCDRGSPVGETEIDRKMNENDDDGMLLKPITRVPGQIDHGSPQFSLCKSEDSCDRGSLFALRR